MYCVLCAPSFTVPWFLSFYLSRPNGSRYSYHGCAAVAAAWCGVPVTVLEALWFVVLCVVPVSSSAKCDCDYVSQRLATSAKYSTFWKLSQILPVTWRVVSFNIISSGTSLGTQRQDCRADSKHVLHWVWMNKSPFPRSSLSSQ